MPGTAETEHSFIGKLSHKLSEMVAIARYGTPMAVSARWRESMAAEAAARSRHRSTRGYSAERAKLAHDALVAGRR